MSSGSIKNRDQIILCNEQLLRTPRSCHQIRSTLACVKPFRGSLRIALMRYLQRQRNFVLRETDFERTVFRGWVEGELVGAFREDGRQVGRDKVVVFIGQVMAVESSKNSHLDIRGGLNELYNHQAKGGKRAARCWILRLVIDSIDRHWRTGH